MVSTTQSDTLSHAFIAALESPRDEIYGLALASEGTGQKAEGRLQAVARELFGKFAGNPGMDVAGRFRAALGGVSAVAPSAMPADVWARLAAAVQVEASKSAATKAINPESVLVNPDPLLAPKKAGPGDPREGLDLPPPSRFLLASVVVIGLGVLLTVYILTRPVTPRPVLVGAGTLPAATLPVTTLPTTAPTTQTATQGAR